VLVGRAAEPDVTVVTRSRSLINTRSSPGGAGKSVQARVTRSSFVGSTLNTVYSTVSPVRTPESLSSTNMFCVPKDCVPLRTRARRGRPNPENLLPFTWEFDIFQK